jgi:hypothetical protein
VLKYLEGAAPRSSLTAEEILGQLQRKGLRAATKQAINLLTRAEEAQAKARNLPAFKFSSNKEMLAAIEKERQVT